MGQWQARSATTAALRAGGFGRAWGAPNMESVRKDIAETRAQTDASLGAERADTDSVRLLAAARARRALDDLIERDRLAADERLKTLREGADRSEEHTSELQSL